jgi:hypothetical protein
VLHLYGSDVSACLGACAVPVLFMCFCAAHGLIIISLHEPVLHAAPVRVSLLYKSCCAAPGRICLQTLCCILPENISTLFTSFVVLGMVCKFVNAIGISIMLMR